jgi:hypothetical protein
MTLSVTEAEMVAATECAQDMLYEKEVLESIGLRVRLPMNLQIDNKGFVDFTQSWTEECDVLIVDTIDCESSEKKELYR